MNKTALIDADIYAYQVAAANQQVIDFGDEEGPIVSQKKSLDECCARLDENISEVSGKLGVDHTIACLTHEYEFRKQIMPAYKGHRDPAKKPAYLKALKQHLIDTWAYYKKPGLEADDCMGILSTHPTLIPGKKVIVSIDKDLESIPGWLFNPDKDSKPRKVTEAEADRRFYMQVLTGDATDGYKGCPGVGPVGAAKILDAVPLCALGRDRKQHPELLTPWHRIVMAYAMKGLTEADALLQARVARICRHTDYDYKKQEVKLWTPQERSA